MKLSARDQKILALAKRETSPEYAADFEPITKGFTFAVAALVVVLGSAAVCMVCSFPFRIFSREAKTELGR